MDTVLITGATGHVGSALAKLLASDPGGPAVRAATRAPDAGPARLLQAMNPGRVEPVRFDPTGDPATLGPAFEGVTRLMLVVPLEDMAAWQEAVLDAAPSSVHQIVKLSVDAAAPPSEDQPEGIGTAHWRGEQMVREAGAETVTMIRPTIFMQHFGIVPGLYAPGEDRFYLPVGESGVAFNDCRDVAYAAYRLLTETAQDALEEDILAFTGPEALTGEEIAGRLSAAAGREIAWERDGEAFEAHSEATGSPAEVGEVYAAGAAGAFSAVETDAYEALTGRRPTSFAAFAHDHAALFAAR